MESVRRCKWQPSMNRDRGLDLEKLRVRCYKSRFKLEEFCQAFSLFGMAFKAGPPFEQKLPFFLLLSLTIFLKSYTFSESLKYEISNKLEKLLR